MRDLDLLANLEFRIQREQFVNLHSLPERVNDCRVDCGQSIAKLNKTADAGRMLDTAPFSDVVELRKEVAREHCLDEPDRASSRQLAHAQAWCETHNPMLLAQSDGGEMLALRLSPQAKPERSIGWKNLWLRFRHRTRIFQSLLNRANFSTPALALASPIELALAEVAAAYFTL